MHCVLIKENKQLVRSKRLQAVKNKMTEDRRGHSNGYKPKAEKTRVEEITFAALQVREGGFYPLILEKGLRSGSALVAALTKMGIQRVST